MWLSTTQLPDASTADMYTPAGDDPGCPSA
jgi:hypothetical protein